MASRHHERRNYDEVFNAYGHLGCIQGSLTQVKPGEMIQEEVLQRHCIWFGVREVESFDSLRGSCDKHGQFCDGSFADILAEVLNFARPQLLFFQHGK